MVISLSRIPQIISNMYATSAGVQSSFVALLGLLGSAGKVYINFIEIDDPLAMVGAILPCALNVFLFLQTFSLEWKSKAKDINKMKTK